MSFNTILNIRRRQNIKWYLLKGKLIENEKLDVTESELKEKINGFINENQDNEKQINEYYNKDENRQRLFDEFLNDKLFEKLKESAKIKVVEQSTEELRKKQGYE